MDKFRNIMMIFVFALVVVLGTTAGSSNAKAATTKNFKGNLNVTYKNSGNRITIKKVNSKKVKIVVKTGFAEGIFTGKVISKNTISMNTGSKYVKVNFKWSNKTHFKSVWKENQENVDNFISNFSGALYNTKYTQVKKSSTVYYSSKGNPYKSVIGVKGNKITVKGKLTKGTKKTYGNVKGKTSKLKSATRTFKLAKNVKFYGNGSNISYNDAISSIKNKEGLDKLPFILTVKNGKVTRIDFYS